MSDQMTPAEMRAEAVRLRAVADVNAGHGWENNAESCRAGADALDALAMIADILPGPRTFAESLSRDFSGSLFPRHIDADKVAGIIAAAFAREEVRDVS